MCAIETDEVVPQEGQDEEYDQVMEEINSLESELNKELKRLEKKVGYVRKLRSTTSHQIPY